MIKKLVQHGNSSALVLDKTLLQILGADATSALELRVEGDEIIIKRATLQKNEYGIISPDKKKQAAYEKIMKKYSGAFEKLAKK